MNFKSTPGLGANNNQFGNANTIFDAKGVHKQYDLDVHGNNESGKILQNLTAYNYGPAASRTAFNAGLENDYQGMLRNLLQRLNNNDGAIQAERAGNATRAIYGQAQGLADQSARAAGLGQGAQLGAQQGLSSQAARAGAAAQQPYLDPRYQLQKLLQALGLVSEAQGSNPYLDEIRENFAPLETRGAANEAARQNRGFTAAVAPYLGAYLGGMGGGGGAAAQSAPSYASPQAISNWAQNFRPR